MRQKLAAQSEQVGQTLNALRTALNDAKYPFSAGLVRAAEEAVLIVYNALNDAGVDEGEL